MSENSRINPEIIVIGAGMNGSMLTKVLRANGFQVLLIDSREPLSGSKCSSGMWRDGWISKELRDFYTEGIEVLYEHAGIDIINCENLDPIKEKKKVGRPSNESLKPKKRIDELMYVDWQNICNVESANVKVTRIENNIVHTVREERGNHNELVDEKYVASMGVFICAGAYTDHLLDNSGYELIGIDRVFGSCIKAQDFDTEMSIIKTWAPYKQTLAARVSKTNMKFSDGSTVKNPPMELDERCSRVHERLFDHIKDVMGAKYKLKKPVEMYGLRPYLPQGKKHQFINQHDSKLFSCTGTAKNTTVLCGYIALKGLEIAQDWRVAARDRKKRKVK